MNSGIIVLLVMAAFIIGAALAWFFFRKREASSEESKIQPTASPKDTFEISKIQLIEAEKNVLRDELAKLKKEKEEILSRCTNLEGANKEIREKLAEANQKTTSKSTALKNKYEQLLAEAKAQCERLDKELANALNGKIDSAVQEQLNEIEKLKKKIKALEEELEDCEDDNDELKKRISSKNAELEELQDDLDKERKAAQQLHDELCDAKQQLEEMDQELDQKATSLSFIQEILSASEVKQSDTRALNREIDNLEAFLKGPLTDVYSFIYTSDPDFSCGDLKGGEALEHIKTFLYDYFDQWASTKRKSWLDGKKTIAFVGEFSAGKTSIVNRILSQDDPSIPQLPVSTKATTAIPTYIASSENVHYNFISGDGKMKVIDEHSFRKVSKETLDQVKGISSLIKYFVMSYPNQNLQGLSVLDTPGFNSNDKEDRERTIDVINECDALFWVFDVNAGTVNRSSIAVIKEKLNKPLYVVINKVDTKPKSEVDKVEALIRKTLANEGLTVQQFIRFSSQAPLEQIMNPIQSVERISNRANFLSDLRTDIEEYLNIFKDAVAESDRSYNNALQSGEELSDEFWTSLRNMQENCERACQIPKWVEHIFSSDRFEMTADEGERLKFLLNDIAGYQVESLSNSFERCIEEAGEIQQEYSNLCDLKATWRRLDDCYEQFKKIQKKIENYERQN